MLHCLCSGLVELIVFVQAQHINNRKYRNSYTINDECRQTIVYVFIKQVTSNIYNEDKVKMFNSLKSCLQDVLEFTPAITLITLF